MSIFLNGYETCSHARNQGHISRMLAKRAQRGRSGTERQGGTRGCILRIFTIYIPHETRLSYQTGVRGVVDREEIKCVQSGEIFKRVTWFADLEVNGRIKLNSSSTKEYMECIGLIWLRIGDCGENFIIQYQSSRCVG